MSEPTGQTGKRFSIRGNELKVAVWVLTVLVVLISLFIILSRTVAYHRLQQSIDEKRKEIASQRERIEELEYWLDAPVDYDYIIKVAREEIGLHFPDEDIYYSDGETG